MSFQTPTLVQGPATSGYVQGVGTTGTGTFTVTLGNTPTNGNTLILTLTATSTTGTNPTISGISQLGVAWHYVISEDNAAACDVEIWYGVVGSGAGKVITITMQSGTGTIGNVADCCEWSGIAGSSVDQTQVNAGSGSTSSGSSGTTATTTQTNELWLACIGSANTGAGSCAQSSPTNSFTQESGAQVEPQTGIYIANGYLYYVASAEGQASTSVTLAGSGNSCDGCIATFKATGVEPVNFVQHWLWAVKQILKRFPRFRGHVDMTKNLKWTGKIWQLLRSHNS